MLEVQKYLQNNTLEQLTAELGIKCKVYPEDNIVLLDYDQIESPKTHPVVCECRSLILSLSDYSVVSRKFNRFFNHGEALDFYKDFKFDGAIAFEKADGSLIGVYYNKFTSTWELSTRGMAKAEGQHYTGKSFREMVLDAFALSSEEDFQLFCEGFLDTNKTYVFEYTSPLNRIVTPYQEDKMVLLSIVENSITLNEQVNFDVDVFIRAGLNVRNLRSVSVSCLEEVKSLVEGLTGLQEGFVVYDTSTQKRMKIKSVNYLVAHKLRGNDPVPSRKNLLTATLGGDIDEFVSYFPEYAQWADPIKAEVQELIENISKVWEDACSIQDQKQFALKVKDYPFSGVLFQAKKTNSSAKEVWQFMDIDKKLRMFSY